MYLDETKIEFEPNTSDSYCRKKVIEGKTQKKEKKKKKRTANAIDE